jgi:hypothetical protein
MLSLESKAWRTLRADHVPPTPKVTTAPEQLDRDSISSWLPAMAVAAGRPELASTITILYGRAMCPECDNRFP